MASIDRIYGTKAQRGELRAWCARNRKSLLRAFYPWYPEWGLIAQREPAHEFSLANFDAKQDRYLMRYCPLPWVRARLREQYGASGMLEETA